MTRTWTGGVHCWWTGDRRKMQNVAACRQHVRWPAAPFDDCLDRTSTEVVASINIVSTTLTPRGLQKRSFDPIYQH
ncbi:unnamed protein product, partial [Trichogramma brassicae]